MMTKDEALKYIELLKYVDFSVRVLLDSPMGSIMTSQLKLLQKAYETMVRYHGL